MPKKIVLKLFPLPKSLNNKVRSLFKGGSVLLFILLFADIPFLSAQVIHKMYFNRFSHYTVDDWITYAPATDITSIDVGEDYVYFGTAGGGILRYHMYDNFWDYPFTTSNGLRSNHILKIIYKYPEDRLYAYHTKGVDVYNRAFNYWEPYRLQEFPERRKPLPSELSDYQKEQNYRFPIYYRPFHNELPDFFTDTDYVFRQPNEILDPFNRIFHLNGESIVDPFRKLWLSTDGLGVASADLDNFSLNFHRQSLPNIFPRDLDFDGENTWIGGVRNGQIPAGIVNWNIEKNSWDYFEARFNNDIYNDNVYCVESNKRFVFFGTEHGLVKHRKKGNKWRTFTSMHRLNSDMINDLFFDGDRLYIASDRGFNWMDPGYNEISETNDTSLDNRPVFKIAAVDSAILLATRDGVFQYFPDKDQVRILPSASSLLDVGISAVNVYSDTIWIAGDYGIMFFDPVKKRWTSFTQIQNQLQAYISDIAFTDKNVWFATDRGLLKYDQSRDYWYLYTSKDGLADDRIYHIDVAGDELWLSTDGGITIFRWYRSGRLE